VFERDNLHGMLALIDAVNDAVITSACAMHSGEFPPESLTDSMPIGRQSAVDELDCRDGGLRWQVPEPALGW
jgi:hypothetical protein